MSFLKLSKFFLTLSACAFVASLVLLIVPGPKLSIEFTGGTLMEIRASGKTKADLENALASFQTKPALEHVAVSAIKGVSGDSLLMRMRALSNDEHTALLAHLKTKLGATAGPEQSRGITELQFTTIGPTVGASLKGRALEAIAIASVAIILYLAFAFRKVPRKLSPWKFGALAVVGFIHDVVVTAGIFVLISQFTSFEFDTLFVTALLTILAYSANDTIVIFDRIRSNLYLETREDFAATVTRALRECVTRTFNTSMAALIMLVTLFFLGSESIRWFIAALILGTIIGAYSSYFIAAPLLIYWRKRN